MGLVIITVFSIKPNAKWEDTSVLINASNAPQINPNLKYSPELFVINEGYNTYAPNLDISADLSMNNDFYFNREGTSKTITFRIFDINYFTSNFDYEVLVIDIFDLASIFEERELVENRDFLEVQFIDDYDDENPYYYEVFDDKYYIYIGSIDNGTIDRVDFTMIMTVQTNQVWTFDSQKFAHNTSLRFMKEWEDYLSIKQYYMLAIERDPFAHKNYTKGYFDGLDAGYDDGYFDGLDAGYDDGFRKGNDKGFADGFREGEQEGIRLASDNTFYGIIAQVFAGLGSFLSIQLLPGISFGAILAVPLVFGIISFIIGKRGGKDD